MSLIGKKIGCFKTHAYANGEFKEISSEDLKGKWSVFMFYPTDFTYVCLTELEDLAYAYDDFLKIDCEIYSVSTDTHFAHKAWHDVSDTVKKIRFPMLADPSHKIAEDFNVLNPEEGLALRGTFIINPEAEIVAYEVNSTGIGRNSKELLRKLQAAQFVAQNKGYKCPAKWEPGAKTISPSLDLLGKL